MRGLGKDGGELGEVYSVTQSCTILLRVSRVLEGGKGQATFGGEPCHYPH